MVVATDKRVKIEEKPEVRKAGGVYYTPKYIVDYIVENTVGKLIAGKKPSEIAEMHFADIACGSGSFLIGVYDCLLKYHNEYYQNNTAQAKKDGCELRDGQYVLTLKQKQDILLNNIYGVDIDYQAVEVTQLSLFLKMLEDENVSTTQKQGSLFLKVLPDLSNNIKFGNSLIGSDILHGQLFSFEEEKKLNPFDYKTAFPKVFSSLRGTKQTGFDAIVGNPPFIQLSSDVDLKPTTKEYLLNKFKSSMGRLNTFGFFTKHATTLVKENGFVGYIIPNTIATQDYYKDLRSSILHSCLINSIVTFDKLPFKDAVVENVILVLELEKSEKKRFSNLINIIESREGSEFLNTKYIKQEIFFKNPNLSFNIHSDDEFSSIKNKLKKNKFSFGDLFEINQAIALRNDRSLWISDNKKNNNYKPLLIGGRNINRYEINWDGTYLNYDLNGIHSCKREDIFLSEEKIFFRRVANRIIATIDTNKYYGLHTLVVMNLKKGSNYNIKYFLAILNSVLLSFYYKVEYASNKKVFSEIGARQVKSLFIPNLDLSKKEDKSKHDKLVQLVELMLQAKQQLQTSKIEREKTMLEQKCISLDKQIDDVVYELYGLTEDEISIIENN